MMNWNHLLSMNATSLVEFVRELYHDNWPRFRWFVTVQFLWLGFSATVFYLLHILTVLAASTGAAPSVDFWTIVVGTPFLLMALYRIAVLLVIAAAFVDSVAEGIWNILRNLWAGIALWWKDTVPVLPQDKTIGINNIKSVLHSMRILACGVLALYFGWSSLIWMGHLIGHPLTFAYRVGLELVLLALVFAIGARPWPYKELPKEEQDAMRRHYRLIVAGLAIWFGILIVGAFGAFKALTNALADLWTWTGLRVPNSLALDQLNWEGWLIVGGIALILLAVLLRGKDGKSYPLARFAWVAGLLMLVIVFWDLISSNRVVRATSKVGDAVLTKIEDRATGKTVVTTTVKVTKRDELVLLVKNAPERNWQLQNCLAIDAPYSLYLVEHMGESKIKHHVLDSVIGPGQTKDLTNRVPEGWALRVIPWDTRANLFFPYDLNLEINEQRKSATETKNLLDPENEWKNITRITPAGPLFSFGCR